MGNWGDACLTNKKSRLNFFKYRRKTIFLRRLRDLESIRKFEIAAYDCGVAFTEIYGVSVKVNSKITSGLIKTTFNDFCKVLVYAL
jgi:hypothetical protein